MRNVTTFKFPITGDSARIVDKNGEPWFVAKDVCEILGLTARDSVRHLDQDEKTYVPRTYLGMFPGKAMLLINESGLFSLIMRSRKSEARRFKRWVTKDVLPAIRKDGGYIMGEEKVKTGEMSEDELILKAVTILTKKVERLTEERDSLQEQVTEHLEFMTVDEWRAIPLSTCSCKGVTSPDRETEDVPSLHQASVNSSPDRSAWTCPLPHGLEGRP